MPGSWFYLKEGAQVGPVAGEALPGLVADGSLKADTLMWREGMPQWLPAGEVDPSLFAVPEPPSKDWFLLVGDAQQGPLDLEQVTAWAREGRVGASTLVWHPGLAGWLPAHQVRGLAGQWPAPPPVPPPPPIPKRGVLGGIGAQISRVAQLPTITNVPIKDILIGGLDQAAKARDEDVEDEFAVGTRGTTPPLAAIATGWPRIRTAYRILLAAVLIYALLRFGFSQWNNVNFLPGMAFIGSFVVPLAIVILFFELNTPRNVSIYQVAKMTALGGACSLVSTMFLFQVVSGAGTGALLPAMLTGVAEETGKLLALLIIVGVARYRWALNGLLFGAAIGAGFAGFESAGYAFTIGIQAFLRAAMKAHYAIPDAFAFGIDQALSNITLRGILAPGGHVIWTAMVGAAIWKVKGARPFSVGMLFEGVVLRRWLIAVVLHGLWDTDLPFLNRWLQVGILILVGWYLIFAILKDAYAEIEAEKAQATRELPASVRAAT